MFSKFEHSMPDETAKDHAPQNPVQVQAHDAWCRAQVQEALDERTTGGNRIVADREVRRRPETLSTISARHDRKGLFA